MRTLIFMLTMPPTPSRNRVAIWRKLHRMGAVVLKGSAWLLPDTGETMELAQWLLQEVHTLGGDAALAHADQIDLLPPGDLMALFRSARDKDFAAIIAEADTLLAAAKAKPGKGVDKSIEDGLLGLRRELERIEKIDYGRAPLGKTAHHRIKEVTMVLKSKTPRTRPVGKDRRSLPAPGSTWVTRPRPGIDRIASAWLIRRFHDERARFLFAERAEDAPRATPFDMLGVRFSHVGEDCTFETLMKAFNVEDARVKAIAEIVHEGDLKDGKFSREESPGLSLTLEGLAANQPDDQKLLKEGMTMFDALYAALERGHSSNIPGRSR